MRECVINRSGCNDVVRQYGSGNDSNGSGGCTDSIDSGSDI